MAKKLISLSLVAMMLSVTVFANPYLETLDTSLVANANSVFKYAESTVNSVTEADGTQHLKDLTAWDGTVATEAPEGDGTAANPYKITDGKDLRWFAAQVDDADDSTKASLCAELTSDINLNSKSWKNYRIGKTNAYTGTFDGNGHTIYNFNITGTSPANDQGGMFRSISSGAVIKDLNFENAHAVSTYASNATSVTYTAIVCGYMTDGTIQNVNVSGTIEVGSGNYAGTAGSIVSAMTKGTIENCYSDATIDLSKAGENTTDSTSAADYGIGGIVGSFPGTNTTNSITIRRCGFEGTINAPKNSRVGGIAGNLRAANGNFLIEECYNTGNITGLRQVAGILGWAQTGAYQKTKRINNNYNTGNIVAKSATNSYAAGISNGAYGTALSSNHSTGDVSVDEAGQLTFNSKCGLLFTNLYANALSQYYTCANSAYCKEYTYTNSEGTSVSKHSVSTNKGTYSTGTGYTEEEFLNGDALETLGTTDYANLKGLNNGYPVFTWQTSAPLTAANTYYVANGSLTLALETPGYVSLYIAPLGGSATVNGKAITEAGTYIIEATNTVAVEGQALITIDLMNQTRPGSALTALEATAIKAEIADTESRTIVLALFNGDALEKFVYTANAELANGAVSAVIDLSSETVTDKTLKAFVWENGTLAPIAGSPYSL